MAAARAKELEYFESKGVWKVRPIEEARKRTGKPPVTVRWVDVNKEDDLNLNIRSRLVARRIGQAGEDAIFAPTPALKALRSCLSFAATNSVVRAHCYHYYPGNGRHFVHEHPWEAIPGSC